MGRASGGRSGSRSRSSGGHSSRSSGSRSSGGKSSGSSRSSGSRSSGGKSSGSSRPSGSRSPGDRSTSSNRSSASGSNGRPRMNADERERFAQQPPGAGGRRGFWGGAAGGCCLGAFLRPVFVIFVIAFIVIIAAFAVKYKGGSDSDQTDGYTDGYEAADELDAEADIEADAESDAEADIEADIESDMEADVEESTDYDFERLESGIAFSSDCITDELGWIEDADQLAGMLEYFYDLTGIQPYIYLADYEESLETEDEMLAYAGEWYDANITDEYTFLYVYFAAEDVDNEIGYMCYVSGTQASRILNEDTIDVFWDYIDEYWDSDLDTVEMFAVVFEYTAETLME